MSRCGWCRADGVSDKARFCSRRCRQSAFRLRRRSTRTTASLTPGCFAYADPPYPGLSSKYYRDEPTFAGEVNHVALIASLRASGYTGWALSTSSGALRDVTRRFLPAVVHAVGATPDLSLSSGAPDDAHSKGT